MKEINPRLVKFYPELPMIMGQLRGGRRVRRLSQKAIGNKIGTQQSAISDLETLTVVPGLDTFQRYANAIGFKVVLSLEPLPIGPRYHWRRDAGGGGRRWSLSAS